MNCVSIIAEIMGVITQNQKLIRIDASLIAPSTTIYEKSRTGYKVFATIGDINQELPYLVWDGKNIVNRVELISKDELFKESSMLSAFGQPVTMGHTPGGYFNLNTDGLQIGSSLQEYRRNDEVGRLDLLLAIQDSRGVRLIDEHLEKGLTPEISPTYNIVKIIRREDGKYWQIGRIYESFALLPAGYGRGGSAIALRFDSKDILPEGVGITPEYFYIKIPEVEPEDLKVKDLVLRVDGKTDQVFRDVDDNLANGVETLMQRVDTLTSQVSDLTGQLSTTQAQLDGSKIKLSEAEKQLQEAQSQRMDDNAIALEIKNRAETWDLVEPFLQEVAASNGKEFRRDGVLTVNQIKELYLKAKDPNLKLDGKDETYITALWDYLAPKPGETSNKQSEQNKTQPQSRVDSLYDWLSGGGDSKSTSVNQGGSPGAGGIRQDQGNADARAAYAKRIETRQQNSQNN